MRAKVLKLDQLPGGTKLRRATTVLIRSGPDGKVYATAPELGLWLDGVGESEDAAIADLGAVIRRYQESLDEEVEDADPPGYLSLMKSAFDDLVL